MNKLRRAIWRHGFACLRDETLSSDRTNDMAYFQRKCGRHGNLTTFRTIPLMLAAAAGIIGPAGASVRNSANTIVAAWTAGAEQRVDDVFASRSINRTDKPTIATVAVTFGKRGYVSHARLEISSGNRTLDYRALEIARNTDFPRLPKALRGTPAATVHVRIHFGEDAPPGKPAR